MKVKISVNVEYDPDFKGDRESAIAFLEDIKYIFPKSSLNSKITPKKTKKTLVIDYPNTFNMYKLICKQEKLLPMPDIEANSKLNLLIDTIGLKSTHVYFNFLMKHRMNDIATEREYFPTISSASAIFSKFSSIVQAIKRERKENRSIFDEYERRTIFSTTLKNAGIVLKDGEYAP